MIRAGIALMALPALGCVSSTDIEQIHSQLAEIQLEVLKLRKEGPSKADVAEAQAAITARIEALLQSEAAVEAELQALSDEIGQLKARLEETHFRLAQLSQQIAATNQELQAVRSAAERARAVAPPPPPSQASNPTDPQSLYDAAYNDYVRGSYDLAILGFLQYLDAFRDTELADNATYWIGECYYLQGKFQQAIDQFDQVLTDYERSDRSPSALLKRGYAHLELGQRAEGVVQLQHVICEYSGTDEAHLARQRLQELGIDVEC